MIKTILFAVLIVCIGCAWQYHSSYMSFRYTIIYMDDNHSSYMEAPYYFILNRNDTLYTLKGGNPEGDVNYVKVQTELYDYYKPCLISHKVLKNCNISNVNGIINCFGQDISLKYYNNVYITNLDAEKFDFNRTDDPFYLGRAYEQIKQKEKSIEYYKKTSNVNKYRKFYSMYRIAVIKMDKDEFLKAYNYHPHRKEPLYYLARMERTLGNYAQCLLYARAGMLVGSPSISEIYVENSIYKYALEDELALCLHNSGNSAEAHLQWGRLLKNTELPNNVRRRIEGNYKI